MCRKALSFTWISHIIHQTLSSHLLQELLSHLLQELLYLLCPCQSLSLWWNLLLCIFLVPMSTDVTLEGFHCSAVVLAHSPIQNDMGMW